MRKGGRFGAVMGLAFVAGVFLSLVAPTQLDSSLAEYSNLEAVELASSTPNGTSPAGAVAENKILDLQPH